MVLALALGIEVGVEVDDPASSVDDGRRPHERVLTPTELVVLTLLGLVQPHGRPDAKQPLEPCPDPLEFLVRFRRGSLP